MAGRREVITHDRRRNSTARKRTHKELLVKQQQQSAIIQRLFKQAKAEARSQQQ